MKPSERTKELLPSCVEMWTEKARQAVTTNGFAPSKEEFQQLLDAGAGGDERYASLMHGILTDAYASAMLQAMDEMHERYQQQVDALWIQLRAANGGILPGDR